MATESTEEQLMLVRRFVERVLDLDANVHMGIDTGADGAIGLICKKRAVVVDIPTYQIGRKRVMKLNKKERLKTGKKTKTVDGKKTVFDYQGMLDIFRELRPIKTRIHVCCEEAQIQVRGKGSGAYVAYRVGIAFGLFPLYLTSRGWPAEYPHPGIWKRKMGLIGKDKSHSLKKAKNLFPRCSLDRKKDHNRAEALLLARYMQLLYD